jgi:hypothetical protein
MGFDPRPTSSGAGQARRNFIRGAAALATGALVTKAGTAHAEDLVPAAGETLEMVVKQSAEKSNTPVFRVEPASADAAPFQVQMNSFSNVGGGAGTYNRGIWFGWNAGYFATGQPKQGLNSVYMGFEDNYFDAGGDETYGVEWYVGYSTPDGTTIGPAGLRPFYFRVKESDTNSADKSVVVSVDIGSGSSGSFAVMGDVAAQNQLFSITRQDIYAHVRARFTAPGVGVQIKPTTGYAALELVAPGTGIAGHHGIIAWRDQLTPVWSIAGITDSWAVRDATNGDRHHLALTPGPTDTTASTTMRSNLSVKGNFGANGASPKPRAAAIAAPASQSGRYSQDDVQSIVKAVNSIRKVLYDFGLTD